MKKWLTLVLAAAMCLAAMVPAYAEEVTFNPVSSLKDGSWIENTNLLTVEAGDAYAVAQMDGTLLTEGIYDDDMDGEYGWLTVADVTVGDINCHGVLAQDGSVKVPCRYGEVDVLSAHWAVAVVVTEATADQYDYETYDNEYYLIDTVDVYNLDTGACAATLPRANFKESYANGTVLNIEDRSAGTITAYDADFNVIADDLTSVYDTDHGGVNLVSYSKNGQEGLMDDAGNVIMEPAFYMIYEFSVHDGCMTVSDGEKEGLIDVQGNVILEPAYDSIDYDYHAPFNGVDTYSYIHHGYIAVEVDDKMGYVDMNGSFTCEPKYATDILDNNGCSALFTDLSGQTTILAADGVETVLTGYESIYAMDNAGGLFYEVHDEDYDEGMVDWHGNVIMPCDYADLEFSGDGKYLLVREDYSGPVEIMEVVIAGEAVKDEKAAEGKPVVLENAPADESEAPAAESASPAVELVNSAIDLINADAAANGTAAASLLDAASALAAGNDGALSILDSAADLLKADAEGNAAAVLTLLETVKPLL